MTDANGLIITVRLPTECFLALNSTYLNSDLPFPIVSLWANCPISLGVRVKWKKKSNFLVGLGGLNEMTALKLLTQYLVYSYHYSIVI